MEGHQHPVMIPNDSALRIIPENQPGVERKPFLLHFRRSIGRGAFGRVYVGTIDSSFKTMAIKQTYLDTNLCYREPEIMMLLQCHCNIRRLYMHSIVKLGNPLADYMLLIMDYIPMTLTQFIHRSLQNGRSMDMLYIRIISYQLFRGLAYLHSMQICHRDIKPDNLMINDSTMLLQISDFGSAKIMHHKEPSTTYICSRFYRAPELFADCQYYSCAVDIWSAGCVLAEMFTGQALFHSILHNEEQLRWMVHTLGPRGLQHAPNINAVCGYHRGSMYKRNIWVNILGREVPPDLAQLLNRCLVYDPKKRIYPMSACAHASYDELRSMEFQSIKMPNGYELPSLFNFSEYELNIQPELLVQLLPLCLYSKSNPVEPNTFIETTTKYVPVKPKDETTV
ncbi:protein kinase shaggy [Drosophila guanche]|uniref:Blast:Glycogen synthase kinase-3 beta n=1 Tax=Drosophila guanche TaxID=7266 RepID=A0A3B0K2F2_DROGU|nr:protein kinase shaggy [Drosophila guanche]SPP82060.1 blast:Glycogen synthase kinase-3 beta [Drosophila guanche]